MTVELWWALVVRVFSLMVGMCLLLWQAITGNQEVWLMAAAIGLAGPPVVAAFALLLERVEPEARPKDPHPQTDLREVYFREDPVVARARELDRIRKLVVTHPVIARSDPRREVVMVGENLPEWVLDYRQRSGAGTE